MVKEHKRSNREVKKPKKAKPPAALPAVLSKDRKASVVPGKSKT